MESAILSPKVDLGVEFPAKAGSVDIEVSASEPIRIGAHLFSLPESSYIKAVAGLIASRSKLDRVSINDMDGRRWLVSLYGRGRISVRRCEVEYILKPRQVLDAFDRVFPVPAFE